MKVALELKLEVEVPDELNGDDSVAWKRWIWNEQSEMLFEATDISIIPPSADPDDEVPSESSPPQSPATSTRRSVNHRLHMLDKLLSKVQRQYLQVEKVSLFSFWSKQAANPRYALPTTGVLTPPFSRYRSRHPLALRMIRPRSSSATCLTLSWT